MFKKLVSNLPFNPSLINEIGFYAKRLHQEETIRRTGFVIMAMAIFVQAFAVIAPPQPTLAGDGSNVIKGAHEKEHVQKALRNNRDDAGRTDIKSIYNYYGITQSDIDSSSETQITTKGANNKDYITTGREISSKDASLNRPINIPGVQTLFYERPLTVWDINNPNGNDYKAITGTATGNGLLKGQQFWILLGNPGSGSGCGNITFKEPPRNPDLDVTKKKVTQGDLEPGDTLEYRLVVQNKGTGNANNVVLTDTLPPELEFVSQRNSREQYFKFSREGQKLRWDMSFLNPAYGPWSFNIVTKVKEIDADKKVCNTAVIVAANNGSVSSDDPQSDRCANIEVPVCENPDAANTGQPEDCVFIQTVAELICKDLNLAEKINFTTYKFTSEIGYLGDGNAELEAVEYYVDGELVETNETSVDALTDMYTHDFGGAGNYIIEARLVAREGTTVKQSTKCTYDLPIVTPQVFEPLPVRSKRVAYTASGEDANNKNVQAGEELTFTLTISNEGDATAQSQRFDDDVSDILEYADITDEGGASYDGVAQALTWEPVDIPAGKSESRSFKVRIKSPIPSTPVEASDPESYDNRIVNTFGNTVSVNVPKTVTKQVEVVVNELPNTGPGLTMALSSMVFAVVGYFFFRSRLMSKELAIIKAQQAAGGI